MLASVVSLSNQPVQNPDPTSSPARLGANPDCIRLKTCAAWPGTLLLKNSGKPNTACEAPKTIADVTVVVVVVGAATAGQHR